MRNNTAKSRVGQSARLHTDVSATNPNPTMEPVAVASADV